MSDLLKNRVIFIANDHAGYRLKKIFIQERPDLKWKNLGSDSEDRVDYPDFASLVAAKITEFPDAIGVLICGSGQGMAMRANKYPAIRAALCWDEESTELARKHNDANVLCIGSRLLDTDESLKILDTFLETAFDGGRHLDRIKKINQPC